MKYLKWIGVAVLIAAAFLSARVYGNILYEDCLNDDLAACNKFISYFSWSHGIGGAYHNRGVAYKKRGERDKAIADFRMALKIGEPGSVVANDFLKEMGENP